MAAICVVSKRFGFDVFDEFVAGPSLVGVDVEVGCFVFVFFDDSAGVSSSESDVAAVCLVLLLVGFFDDSAGVSSSESDVAAVCLVLLLVGFLAESEPDV